jgi:hypothetical protein
MNSAIQFLATPFLCKEYFCSSKNSILKRINGKQNEIENHTTSEDLYLRFFTKYEENQHFTKSFNSKILQIFQFLKHFLKKSLYWAIP